MSERERVYLAGPSAELGNVIAVAEMLAKLGYTITEPWWERVVEASAKWGHDSEVPVEYMRESAERNRQGIESADVIIALARTTVSTGGFSSGCAGEIGYACALHHGERIPAMQNRIICVGDAHGFIWTHFDCVTVVESIADAVALLDASRLV